MKNYLLLAILTASISSIAAADEIEVQSAGVSNIITVGGSYSNANFNGWDISIVTGTNYSMGLSPYGLDLQVLASCASGSCLTNALDVYYTAQNFNVSVPAGGFETTYAGVMTGGGTTRAITWADATNTLFGGGLPPLGADHLGTVGPFSAPGGFGSTTGGPAEGPTPYSLTIEAVFTSGGSGVSSFSTDGNVTAAPVPVPSPLALLASGLLGAMLFKRRSRALWA